MKKLYRGLLLAIWGVGLSSVSWGQCFNQAVDYNVGGSPVAVIVADFNSDGRPDLATANQSSNSVSVLFNNGTGGFNSPNQFSVNGKPESLAVSDFNGDGKLDLFTFNLGDDLTSKSASVLLNDGSGGFGSAIKVATGPLTNAVAAGDFNGDGKSDLAFSYDFIKVPIGGVTVMLGNGQGGFDIGLPPGDIGYNAKSMTSSDFNNDGKLDLLITYDYSPVSINLGIGNGNFERRNFLNGSLYSVATAIGDFDADGKLDVATANSSNTVSILHNYGNGYFNSVVEMGDFNNPVSITTGDFNGDGKLDVATANAGNNTVSVLQGNSDGLFSSIKLNFAVGSNPRSLAIGDFNGDGRPDLVTANANANTLSVLLNCTSTSLILTLAQPTYDCTTGQLSLSTTGGNGQPIEYRIAGVRDWSTANTFTIPAYQRNNTTFTLEARQSGAVSSLPFMTTYQSTTPIPPVTPPTPPTGTGLTLTTPAYDCTSGQLALSTTGGNGALVEYRIAGLRDWATSNTFTIPAYQRTGTSFTLEARQSGVAVSLPFTAACQTTPLPTTPPTTPPTGTPLSVTTLSFDCQSGALQLATAGGDGNPVDFKVPGLRDYANSPSFTVPAYQRTNTSFTLYARQSGREVTTTYTAGCPLAARLASPETTSAFNVVVYPNPVGEQFNVGVSGAAGRAVRFHLTNISGQTILEQRTQVESDAHTETLRLPTSGAGLYLLQVSTPGQSRTVKVMKP